jgi:uncharacterized phiE125 gp8 family phage protein
VTSIKTFSDDDTATVYAASNYNVDTASAPGRIVLRNSASPPNPTRAANGIEIIYVAGYGDAPHNVPQGMRDGVLAFLAQLYQHRGDEPEKLLADSGALTFWERFRVVRL